MLSSAIRTRGSSDSLLTNEESGEAENTPDVMSTDLEQDTSEDDDESFDGQRSSKTARKQREALNKFQAGELNLKSQAGIELFEKKYKKYLTNGTDGDTLVHLILGESESDKLTTFHLLLRACLRLMPSILEVRNHRGETPLHLAIERHGISCHNAETS